MNKSQLINKRSQLLAEECKRWFEHMIFKYTGNIISIPDYIAFSLFMQGQAMCAFGEYILDPTEDRRLVLSNVVYGIGWEEFKF